MDKPCTPASVCKASDKPCTPASVCKAMDKPCTPASVCKAMAILVAPSGDHIRSSVACDSFSSVSFVSDKLAHDPGVQVSLEVNACGSTNRLNARTCYIKI